MAKIRPLGDRVVVKPEAKEEVERVTYWRFLIKVLFPMG